MRVTLKLCKRAVPTVANGPKVSPKKGSAVGQTFKVTPPKQYFPIKDRVVDSRIDALASSEQAQITLRRRELRTEVDTGRTRQVEPPAWSAARRPTHFLSLRFPQRNAFSRVATQFLEEVRFSFPTYEPLLIPVSKLHVTLSVMTLDGVESATPTVRSVAEDVLPEAASPEAGVAAEQEPSADHATTSIIAGTTTVGSPDVRRQPTSAERTVIEAVNNVLFPMDGRNSSSGPIQLSFRGLGTFNHDRVLFTRVTPDNGCGALHALVMRLRKILGLQHGIDMKGNPHDGFVPHVTLAKIRPNQVASFGRQIPIGLWAPIQHEAFGDVLFDTVDLCEMATDPATGYYRIVHSFSLRGAAV